MLLIYIIVFCDIQVKGSGRMFLHFRGTYDYHFQDKSYIYQAAEDHNICLHCFENLESHICYMLSFIIESG